MGELEQTALVANEVSQELMHIYNDNVLPLEQAYKYDAFYDNSLRPVDFSSRPLVLVIGQYSTGKTTFIRHLIGRDFPGMRIGPEPTTDKFTAVFYGQEDQIIPGTALQSSPGLPFAPLGRFGQNFLNKFEGSACKSNALKSFTFIDSPGVLSGKKQRDRQYNYQAVLEWFAQKATRILLLFDCNKLDISDEFQRAIHELRKHDDKIRVVLNKADSLPEKELIRVYGALMWSLGKVFKTPEVLRVYISSFWDKPLDQNNYCYQLFKGDAADLIGELKALPRQNAMQRITEIIKRARLVKLHCLIIAKLRDELPRFLGRKRKMAEILSNLTPRFKALARDLNIPPQEFPKLTKFKETLIQERLDLFPKTNPKTLKAIDNALEELIPDLIKKLSDHQLGAHKVEADAESNYNPFLGNMKPRSSARSRAGSLGGQSFSGASVVSKAQELQGIAKNAITRYSTKMNVNFSKFKRRQRGPVNSLQEVRVAPNMETGSMVSGDSLHSGSPRQNLSFGNKRISDDREKRASARQSGNAYHKSGGGNRVLSDQLVVSAVPSPRAVSGLRRPNSSASVLSAEVPMPLHSLGQLSVAERQQRLSPPGGFNHENFDPTMWRSSKQLAKNALGPSDWIVTNTDKTESDNIFYNQVLIDGKLTGSAAKNAFAHTGLDNPTLFRIWKLVDFDETNELDDDQFALAIVLAKRYKRGEEIPEKLTWNMIPPSHRNV